MLVNYKKRSTLPKDDFYLNVASPIVQELVIKMFVDAGIPIYDETEQDGYDMDYPYLVWDQGKLSQSASNRSCRILLQLEEFLSHFFEPAKAQIAISDDYVAEVKQDEIVVGCQHISFDAVQNVYLKMLELRGEK
jgi:hypothetical protein